MSATKIAVTSAKGGTGKTTMAANIATALALEGNRVLAVDLNIGFRNLDFFLIDDTGIVFDYFDVASAVCLLDKAAVKSSAGNGNLSFVSCPQRVTERNSDITTIKSFFGIAESEYDYIIADCPVYSGVTEYTASIVDIAIIVTTTDFLSLRNSDKLISSLEGNSTKMLGLINMFSISDVRHNKGILAESTNIIGVPILGIVPREERVRRNRMFVLDKQIAGASAAVRNIASRIMGKKVPLFANNANKSVR